MTPDEIETFTMAKPKRTLFYKWIVKQVDKSWVKWFFIPICYGLPVFFINSSFSNDKLAKWLQDNLGVLGGFLGEYQAWVIILAFVIYGLISVFYSYIKSIAEYTPPPPPDLSKQHAISIIQTLEIVVQAKYKRFIDTLKTNISSQDIFKTITQPNLQKDVIIQALKSHLELQFQNSLIKVGLMRVENKSCVNWENYLPATIGPKTEIHILNSKTSCIKRCIESKTLIIVEDTFRETKKPSATKNYIKGKTPDNESGSQICYPILHPLTNEVIYVIAVSCNKSQSFKQIDLEFYKWLLGVFAQRLLVEISLDILKQKFHEENSHAA